MTVEPQSLVRPARDGLMTGKCGLIMGVANDHSIAYGIARALWDQGAKLAFTYQTEALGKRVRPLAAGLGSDLLFACDVDDRASMNATFAGLGKAWGKLDFVVHAVAFSDKEELKGRYVDTSRENFVRTLVISCFSFTEVARLAAPMMTSGGALLTLSYAGAERVMPSYNVMGIAKAALESSVRYLAADLGPQGIRVNALSAGPMRTLAGAAVGAARYVYRFNREHSPLKRNVQLEDVGGAGLYLLSDLSSGVTGEVHHVDAGFHVIGIPAPGAASSENGGPEGEGSNGVGRES
jgi:enoyl-[acyl-carrier protein] reductase I